MEDPETLIAYAKIFELPRRYVKGGTLHSPGSIELAAARALRWYAKCVIMANSGIGDPVEEMKQDVRKTDY